MRAKTNDEANEFFAEAEKVMMQDPPLAILFYGENLWLKQASLKDFYTNGMNYVDFTSVYIDTTIVKEELTEKDEH